MIPVPRSAMAGDTVNDPSAASVMDISVNANSIENLIITPGNIALDKQLGVTLMSMEKVHLVIPRLLRYY